MTKPTILVVTTDKDLLRTFYTVAIKLDMKLLPLAEVSSRDFLAQPWHDVIVDSATPNIDGISLLSLVRSLSPFALRGLVVSSPDHQLLLRAVNEAQVHHIWVKPLSAKEIMDALQQQTEIAGGRTLPLLLATAFESKTETGHGHSYRVAQYALALGHELGLTEDNLRALQLGCLFHDIGKLLLPDQLLKNQTSQVSPVEQTLIRQHPVLGEQLVKGMDLPSEAIRVIRYHHERWDGQGYPDRLQGEMIPLLARIASVANAYDHLTEPKGDSPPLSHSEINALLKSEMGQAFDPKVVRALLNLRETQDVWEVLEQLTELPALAPVVQQALVLLEREDFDWHEVAEVIAQDQNLVAQLLKLANSALTGLRRKVTSLPTALRVLGARPVRNLLLTMTVRPFLQVPSELQLWEHSLACGLVAKRLAQQTKLVDPEEAFTAGLLHDIGKTLLIRFFPQSYRRVQQIARRQGCPTFIAERLIFSVTHAEIGAWLLERWRIPSPFCEAVAVHHTPVPETQPLAWHLYWANQFIHFALGDMPLAKWGMTDLLPPSLHPIFANPEKLVQEAMAQVKSVENALL
jgi:putative nucleotidyltransferase with HDIG domain